MRDPWPLSLFVVGHPKAYGSKIPVINWAERKWFLRESSKAVVPWKKVVREAFQAQIVQSWGALDVLPIPQGTAVALTFEFWIPTPKATKNLEPYPTRMTGPYGGDWDKLARAVGDCGTDAGLWWDDCQIVEGYVRKRWANKAHPAGCRVSFWPVDAMEG